MFIALQQKKKSFFLRYIWFLSYQPTQKKLFLSYHGSYFFIFYFWKYYILLHKFKLKRLFQSPEGEDSSYAILSLTQLVRIKGYNSIIDLLTEIRKSMYVCVIIVFTLKQKYKIEYFRWVNKFYTVYTI